MLAVAEERRAARGLANYSTRVVDGGPLPFGDGSFDAVLSRLGVMFFPDPAAALRDFRRVLRPGGRAAMTVWADPAKNVWITGAAAIVNEMLSLPAPDPKAPGGFRFAEPGSLPALLADVGFVEVEERPVSGEIEYESPAEYLEAMLDMAAPLVSALNQAPEPRREEVKEALLAAAAARARPDGSLAYPWCAWLVRGVAPA
jgi:SAM-dependent methyltransferase